MKSIILVSVMLCSTAALAKHPFMPIKERLRIQLWVQGVINEEQPPAYVLKHQKRFPEELDRALKKL